MKRTIPQLIPRFARLGLYLAPVPNTDPQAWTARDKFTGEVEDFGGPAPNGSGDDLATIRRHLHRQKPIPLREHRVRTLAGQGKNIPETAGILGVHWATVANLRKRHHLPCIEPRGAKTAWTEGHPFTGEPKSRARTTPSTPASLEAERLLREGMMPTVDIARRVNVSRQRVCQIRDRLGLPHWTLYGARRQQLAELVAAGVLDMQTLAGRLGCTVGQVRADAKTLGLTIETSRTRAAKRRALLAKPAASSGAGA